MIKNIAVDQNREHGQQERKTHAKYPKNKQKTIRRKIANNKKKSDIEHHRWRPERSIKTKKNTRNKQSRHGQASILPCSIPEGKYRHKKILRNCNTGFTKKVDKDKHTCHEQNHHTGRYRCSDCPYETYNIRRM